MPGDAQPRAQVGVWEGSRHAEHSLHLLCVGGEVVGEDPIGHNKRGQGRWPSQIRRPWVSPLEDTTLICWSPGSRSPFQVSSTCSTCRHQPNSSAWSSVQGPQHAWNPLFPLPLSLGSFPNIQCSFELFFFTYFPCCGGLFS